MKQKSFGAYKKISSILWISIAEPKVKSLGNKRFPIATLFKKTTSLSIASNILLTWWNLPSQIDK